MSIKPKLKKLRTRVKRFLKVQRNRRKVYYVLAGLLIITLLVGWTNSQAEATRHKAELSQTQTRLQGLIKQYQAVQEQKAETDQQVKKKAESERKLRQEIKKLEKALQAKRNKPSISSRVASVAFPKASAQSGCGDNEYAQYIYQKESGCSTTARNAGGCLGLGQSCPGSKLLAVCPNLDYACENAFFTQYATSRYGSWQGAYNFWLGHGWW